MVQQGRVRTALMQNLKLFHQFGHFASKSLWHMDSKLGIARLAEFCCDLFLAESIVLQTLGGFLEVDLRGKYVVQAELAGEHVHRDS